MDELVFGDLVDVGAILLGRTVPEMSFLLEICPPECSGGTVDWE